MICFNVLKYSLLFLMGFSLIKCYISSQIKQREKYYALLFEQALKENRPLFVDYILRQYYNPLETTACTKYKRTGISTFNQSFFCQ